MKNQIFDAGRFSAYFKKYVAERRNSLLMIAGVLFLFPLAFCLGWPQVKGFYSPDMAAGFVERDNIPDPMWSSELVFYFVLWITACVFCYDFYSFLTTKKERISLLTCPASDFEKFLTSFLVFAVAVPLLYVIGFFLADAIRVWIYRANADNVACIHYIAPRYLLSFGTDLHYFDLDYYIPKAVGNESKEMIMDYIRQSASAKFSLCIFIGLFLQSMFALGSSVWPKKNLLKTTCFLWAAGMTMSMLFYWGIRVFYGHSGSLEPRNFGIENGMTQILICDLAALIFVMFVWILSYFRFKEWEVIKRW